MSPPTGFLIPNICGVTEPSTFILVIPTVTPAPIGNSNL